MSIDINCDLGESFGRYKMGNDNLMMKYITSANIACGFHAGDFITMRRTVCLCLESGVSIGAHPSYPDLQGFGRRNIDFTPEEIYTMVLYQIGALKAITEAEGGYLAHVKPHGAMYNYAAGNSEMAFAIAEAVRKAGEDMILLCMAGTAMEEAAVKSGVMFATEAFSDRQYTPEGRLVSRSSGESVITNPEACASRAVEMVTAKRVITINGKYLPINPDSICVHGDTTGAVEILMAIREAFENKDIPVKPFKGRRVK
jgi:5-oxoprolinase (ATP-hydrolysing) subunit A